MMAYLVLALGFFGVILGGRPFAKLQWGHFYIFDWVAVIWLLLTFLKINPNRVLEFIKKNKWIVFYFLYGAFLLMLDFFSKDFHDSPFRRIAQHSIIFVYPLIWTFIGFLSYKINPGLTDKVIVSILASFVVSHILFILFPRFLELSLGLVIIVFVLHFLSKEIGRERLKGVLFLVVLFLPFWQMWGASISRTGLLELLLCIIFLPFLIFRKSYRRSFLISAGMVVLLFMGFTVISEFRHFQDATLIEGAQSDFFKGALHGEDVSPGEHVFHARFRTYVWKTTISDWLEHPVLGVGFIPEIPSSLEPGVKNNGGYFYGKDAPPVSGAHNSYLTILARMGPFGLGLLLIALGAWMKKMYSKKHFLDVCLFVIPLLSLFGAIFNIGIEAPQSSVVLWFCYGIGMAL